MEYLQTLYFAGVNSKRRYFSKKEEKNSSCSSLCRDRLSGSQQTSKQMAREPCCNNILCVATQDLNIGRWARSQQKIACRDKKWEEAS